MGTISSGSCLQQCMECCVGQGDEKRPVPFLAAYNVTLDIAAVCPVLWLNRQAALCLQYSLIFKQHRWTLI